ncbi:hypothetical protein EV363DRAFT_1187897, partial [Boletus edulis]
MIPFRSLTWDEKASLIDEVRCEFNLNINEEQNQAFTLVAEHFARGDTKQLRMFLTGVGGSGKSHVIKAIVSFFTRCGSSNEILLSAPNGSAAVLIDGYTIHALTFLP